MTRAHQRAARPRGSPEPPRLPIRGRRIWAFRLVALGGALLLALVAGEIAVRLLNVGPQVAAVSGENFRLSDNPRLRYELLPGSTYRGSVVNAAGFRGPDLPAAKPPGTFRIACIGDSICFGYQMPPEDTLPARLEEYLNRCYGGARRFEVLNLGVTGYNITQVVENLRVRGWPYEPDAIVYCYCLNDAQEYSFELEGLLARLTGAERNYWDRLRQGGSRLSSHSRLYVLARYLLEARTAAGQARGDKPADPQWLSLDSGRWGEYYQALYRDPANWQRVRAGLAELAALTRPRPVPVYVAIFPVLRGFDGYPLLGVHAQVAAAAAEQGLRVVDLLEPYRALARVPGARFAWDYLHPDAAGHAYAAVVILRALLREGALPVADRDVQKLAAEQTPAGRYARELMQWLPGPPR